ncbi:acyl carrier protein [Paraherbaspirillum soli]|uniref:Acyl carrier protein n=1 Tax=Paraherbaspirillum soli TaxID=631222 RepID=A0ABW0MFD7_9BURK
MSKKEEILEAVLDVINSVKKTGFTRDAVEPDFYLGGDLGVDSKEMLEIWYELEQRLNIRVLDAEKRDLYTLNEVIDLLQSKLDQVVANHPAQPA